MLVVFSDAATDTKLLSTTPAREVGAMSPRKGAYPSTEPVTSMTGFSADMMTSLCCNNEALLWMRHREMADAHGACAEVFPPPIQDRISSNAALFPFPVNLLSPTMALGHRRAVTRSWSINALAETGKDLLNAATSSLLNQPLIGRLPWPPPLCCLLQPEIARQCRASVRHPLVGNVLPTQPLQRVPSRRGCPVNWLLSDDVRVASSAHRDRTWNSAVDRRPTCGASEKRPPASPPSRSSVPAAGGTSTAVGGDRKLTCRHCGKPYASLGALKMHIRTHTLPCRCQLCGKAFSRPWLLQGHLRTHTGERPFACPQCGRAFADRSNLRAHLQTHAELKKYACDRCTKTFSRLSLLVKHRNGPTVCGAAAAASSWRP